MTTLKKRILPAAAAIAVALSPSLAAADPPRVEARLSPAEIGVGETALLSVTVSGAVSNQPPRVPSVEAVDVSPAGSSQQVTIINGEVERQTTHHYRVAPRRRGRFTIGPVTVDGVQSRPLRLTVARQGRSAAPGASATGPAASGARTTTIPAPPGRRAFLRVIVEDDALVVGESTDVTVRAYVKAGTAGTVTGAPELSSDAFAIHDLTEDAKQGRAKRGDTRYATLTWRGKLTALLPGEHELSAKVPATLTWRDIVRTEHEDPFAGRGGSLFDRFFANDPFFANNSFFSGGPFASIGGMGSFFSTSLGPRHSRDVVLEDDVGTVTVREAPSEGRPEGFDGAIGRFELSAEVTPATVHAGEPITLRLVVTGDGNFARVHHTMLPESTAGVRVYAAESEMGDGSKVFEQSLVPTEVGTLSIPALTLPHYDPEAGAYTVATTEPLTVEVLPPVGGETPSADLDAAVGPSGRGLSGNALDPGAFVSSLAPIGTSPWPYLGALGLMCLGLGAGFALRRRDPAGAAVRRGQRRLRREARAARRAARAAARAGDAPAFFAAASELMQVRLGGRWDIRPDAVTLAEAEARLAEVPPALRGAFLQADAYRFGGAPFVGGPSDDDLNDWLEQIEHALDEEIPS